MTRNVFVLGLTDLQRRELQSIRGAPEGSMFEGSFSVHGFFDMPKDKRRESFVRHIGFDNALAFEFGPVPEECAAST